MTSKVHIGIIGAGNMGTAILSQLKGKYRLCICEKDQARARLIQIKYKVPAVDMCELIKRSDIIVLAVKPQDFAPALEILSQELTAKKLVVSIAAGITTSFIERKLPKRTRVIRVMPNLPAVVKEGMTAIAKGRFANARDLATAKDMFDRVGKTVIVSEKLMDTVTAVSGSGPAYVFLFVECFAKAAQELGLEEKLSQQLISQTLRGSLKILDEQNESAEILRGRVTSKGGTTQAAMDVFSENKIQEVFRKALLAAKNRAGELSK